MRVIAIRGENLASLAFPFVVELERPPLAGTGLFAISGPTGAGKSTLLDALCLALFDAVPRLAEGSSALVGGEGEPEEVRLAANDVRSILTRGAGRGHAEVDFVGNDGRRYRARWEVRRAGGKARGKYQRQTLSLRDLDEGCEVGHTKTDVLALISERLGLTFEQFRRAALLAQGDFAAFLKAKERERSELLERITGTEIYGQISRAAYTRANEEGQALREGRAALAALSPLELGPRGALEGEVASTRRVFDAAEGALGAAKGHQLWCERQAELDSAAVQAEQALAATAGAVAGAAPRRETLRAVAAAEPLRAPIDRADRTCRERDAAARQHVEASQREGQASADVAAAEGRVQAAAAAGQAAEQARRAARPDIEAARRLDTQRTECQARLAQVRAGAEAAAKKGQGAEAVRLDLLARRAALVADRDREVGWLQSQAALALLVAEWGRWSEAIKRYATSLAAARGAGARLQTLAAEYAEAVRDLDGARTRQGVTAVALQGAREARDRVEADCAGYNLALIRAEENALVARQAGLSTLRQCAQDVAEKTAVRGRLLTEAGDLDTQATRAVELAQARDGEIAAKAAAIAEARTARDRLLAASTPSAEDLRSHLASGDPCPVCGATDHPWAVAHPAFEPLRRDAEARLQALEAERMALVTTQAGEDATAREKRGQAVERRERALQAETELAALEVRWATVLAAEGLPATPSDPTVPAALAGRMAEVEAALEDRRRRLSAAIECQRRREAAARALDEARDSDDAARRDLDALGERVQRLEQDRAVEGMKLQQASAEVERARSTLATPFASFADWEQALSADPEAFLQEYQNRVGEWKDHERAQAGAETALAQLAPRIAEAEATASGAAEHARREHDAADGQATACSRLEAERRVLLGGRPADEVEAEWQERERAARSAHQRAEAELAGARGALAGARASAQHWAEELRRKGQECDEARLGLEAALAASGMDLAAARPLLAHDPSWVHAERVTLEALARKEQDARVLAVERRRQADAHAATRPEGLDCAGVAEVLEQAQAQHEQAQSTWAAAHGRLLEDDKRRLRAGELAEQVAEREASTRVWEQLRELIGSADGNKFRIFAQSLTLDALLAHANRHLEDLARRYRLERSPGSDLALQVVDADMGDEVRSVYSLSGGESFLVSLALALGLASLASHRTRVESLFIDEGFGSLDPETLDTAIASLDALQALGRKVGVISHVPTLVERIGIQVRVEPRGGGRSGVRTVAREAASE